MTPKTHRDVISKCRDIFAKYEADHLAKKTPDGYRKAATNAEYRQMCEAVLREQTDNSTGAV